ncbi:MULTISPECIES: hypothetical protein [unclassified Pseudomonas]|uniref:hypothetical protein n=1 Tax=unclassified Pseudomonas TaxID=196821 RepID=UPI000C2FC855|nr:MULTISPECIES: hypothetical protein [unclassified Pseudomonas]MCU1737531.1 hypothetical protein [Pseudomonas sp. 20S_6.2_Bac1]
MTNQTEPQPDVFDMSRTVPAHGVAPEVEKRETVEPKLKRARKAMTLPTALSFEKVKKYGVPAGLVMVVVIGGLWSFVPGVFSLGGGTSSAPRSVTAQPSFTPADAMRDAGQATVREAQRAASSLGSGFDQVPAAVVGVTTSTTAPRAEPEHVAPVAPQGVSVVEKELQTRVVTLEQSMVELQAKIALLEGRPVANVAASVANVNATKSVSAKNNTHKAQKNHPPGTQSSAKAASQPVGTTLMNKGFTLNTIYAGQAWIQDSEQVYVVQVGDLVGDMRIQSIDPKGRRVMTTKGIIR